MHVYRYEENPLITPADVTPHREDFEVIGAFNAGIAKYGDEIIMLLRVAERPISPKPGIVLAPVYDAASDRLDLIELREDDERYDFSDPRVIRNRSESATFQYLTSLSYLRIARSRDGRHFTVDDKPFIYPSQPLESFGIEDPRITQIGDTYYIYPEFRK
ncbi:glycosidase, partial [Paenibacillus cisolokensis]